MFFGKKIINTNVMSTLLTGKKSSLYHPFRAHCARSYRSLRHSHRSIHRALSFLSCLIVPIMPCRPIVPYRSYHALLFQNRSFQVSFKHGIVKTSFPSSKPVANHIFVVPYIPFPVKDLGLLIRRT